MHPFDQRSPCAAEKVGAQETGRDAPGVGGVIRGSRCGAVAGKSVHGPMT